MRLKHIAFLGCLLSFITAFAADRLELVLELPGPSLNKTQAGAILQRNIIRGGGPLVRPTEPISEAELVVVAVDAEGREIHRQVVADPNLVRGELFDPQTGAFVTRRTVTRTGGQLTLVLPDEESLDHLVVYRPRFEGDAYQLEHVRTYDLNREPTRDRMDLGKADPDVVRVIDNGDSSDRIDIVFFGDGYTRAELGDYARDVDTVIQSYFDTEPYRSYRDFFNVLRVDAVSNQSGVDHPELGQYRDTAFEGTYNCGGVQRLICVDTNEVQSVAGRVLAADARDTLIVIVNDDEYGGSGGAVSVISTNGQTVDLALHEIGHSFGRLADEYTYNSERCDRREPSERNVTAQTRRDAIKWNHWIDASTPIPTTGDRGAEVGLFQGGRYCTTGIYRPTDNSMMRTLGRPFHAVNEEALILRMYQFIQPITGRTPDRNQVELNDGETMRFAVEVPGTRGDTIQVRWLVDGLERGTGTSFDLTAQGLSEGNHSLLAEAADLTEKVRLDPNDDLKASVSWTVVVHGGGGGDPQEPETPQGLSARDISASAFTLEWRTADRADRYEVEREVDGQWRQEARTTETHHAFSGLPEGSTQRVRVRALNDRGASPFSAALEVRLGDDCDPNLVKPSGLAETSHGTTSFSIAWTAVAGATGYRLQLWGRSQDDWVEAGTSTTADFTFTGLETGSEQWVRVRAENACGQSEYSDDLYVKLDDDGCDGAPATVGGLEASDVGSTSFDLAWNAVTGATGYRLQLWSDPRGEWVEAGTSTAARFTFTGLEAGSEQWPRVRAENACGASTYSDYIHVVLDGGCSGAPGTPTALRAENVSRTSFDLTWGAVDGAERYALQLWNGYGWSDAGTATTPRFSFTGLNTGSTQYVQVRAVNACGAGSYSSWLEVVLESACTGDLDKPTGLYYQGAGRGSARLYWRPVTGATRYEVQIWTGSTWADLGESRQTNFLVQGYSGYQYVRARAVSDCGSSEYSDWIPIFL
ncbi:Fibronectin type III domain-containing protein [Sulfidibacter corallicola]|uniref:Fibronectin type III domain-containing protein n=1 Tax=Sulfidibacter corallicola TaxID=2818388 RepID=A0A8A4TU44_SULCO|nr:M64 family metallopeptidase [Sulfidibacter corallicola]QTD52638.1 fibronectin type III domain-containing protein [Sulfidibacter corallicola]